jgi:hypothetical protein
LQLRVNALRKQNRKKKDSANRDLGKPLKRASAAMGIDRFLLQSPCFYRYGPLKTMSCGETYD